MVSAALRHRVNVLRRVRRRLAGSMLSGLLAAFIWHVGREEPAVDLSSLAFWLHWIAEGIVALGLALAIFVVSGAALRYQEAVRRLDARPVNDRSDYD